jgi:hypothetical protein
MRWCNSYNNPLVVAMLVNLGVLILAFFFTGWRYESLDDYFMHGVLTGAYGGQYDVHLYFINAVYAYFLKPFYLIMPRVGWYSLFEIFFVFLSFSFISYMLLKKMKNKWGFSLVVLLCTCVAFDFYLHVEFTRCAAITSASGIFIIARGNREKRITFLILGCLLMLVGFTFRKEMFLLGLPTLGVLLFFDWVTNKSIWKGLVFVSAFFIGLLWSLNYFDASLYRGNGYDYYAAYQKPRAFFGDGAFYDFEDFCDELDELGIGARNARYLRSWYFYDDNVFSLDGLNELVRIAQRSSYEPNYLKFPFAIARSISDSLMCSSVWLWLFLCFALIYFANKKYGWIPWISLFTIGISYFYLVLVNRVVTHVESGIWAYAVIPVLYYASEGDFLNNKKRRIMITITFLICVIGLANTICLFEFDKKKYFTKIQDAPTAEWTAFLQYVHTHPNDVFLLPFTRYKELGSFLGKTYNAVPPGSWNNIYSTGYWNIHLPSMKQELQRRGVSNLFRDVINENVFVMNDRESMSLVPFYKDHYHKEIGADTVKTFGRLFLLKYYVKELCDDQKIR